MGEKIDLYVYAVDINEGTIAKVSGSNYNAFINGEKELAITLENSVEMKENRFGPILRKHGISANLIFLTTAGLVAATEGSPVNITNSVVNEDIAELYSAFDQYFNTRAEQGAHLHENQKGRKRR